MISALISTKNHGQFLESLIATVLSGASPVTELLICDDASTDRTPEILGSQLHRKGLRLFRNDKSIGWDKSVSSIYRHAVNPYVLFMSSDDYFFPEKLAELFRSVVDSGAFVGFGKYFIDNQGIRTEVSHPGWKARTMEGADDFMSLMAFDHYAFFATTIFKKSILPGYGETSSPFDLTLGRYVTADGLGEFRAQDWNLLLDLSVRFPDRFLFFDQFCACFRQVPDQLSATDKYAGTGRAVFETAILILKYLTIHPLRMKILGSPYFHNALKSQFYAKFSQVREAEKQSRNFKEIYLPVLKAAEALIA